MSNKTSAFLRVAAGLFSGLVMFGAVAGLDVAQASAMSSTPDDEQASTPSVNECWTGTFHSEEFGYVALKQNGKQLTGKYDWDDGTLSGTHSGQIAEGEWSESPTYQAPYDAGQFKFVMQPNCNFIHGSWRYGTSGEWQDNWDMTRVSGTGAGDGDQADPADPEPAQNLCSTFAGKWVSDDGDSLELTHSGDEVAGSGTFNGSKQTWTATATALGDRATGTWRETFKQGGLRMTLDGAADCRSMTGATEFDGVWTPFVLNRG